MKQKSWIIALIVLIGLSLSPAAFAITQIDAPMEISWATWDMGDDGEVGIGGSFSYNTIDINYSFNSGDWCYVKKVKNLPNDIFDLGISFTIQTTGDVNDLQIKWIDADGSIFGTTIDDANFPTAQNITLNHSDFSYLWGGDDQLDEIVAFEITIVRDDGGDGTLTISDLNYSTLFSSFDAAADWNYGSHNNTPFTPTFDGDNKTLILDYEFSSGDFCFLQTIDQVPYKAYALGLSFDLKTEGYENNLELKWVDQYGGSLACVLEALDHPAYTHYELKAADFTGTGVTGPTRLEIVISNNQGGYGRYYIKDLKKNSEPIAISSLQELQNMDQDLDEDYYLTCDIDASDTANWNGGAGFDPISSNVYDFTGTFDGRHHTISGLAINRATTDIGLFGRTVEATIQNITLNNVSITGTSFVGALIGSATMDTTITNCNVSGGSITGTGGKIGGLIGDAYNTVAIDNCHTASLTVTGSTSDLFTGGLVGVLQQESTIANCSTKSSSIIGGGKVGGLVGYAYNATTIEKSKAVADSIEGETIVGGLIGSNLGLVRNCYASTDVWGDTKVGGFAGDSLGTINKCYSTALIFGSVDMIGGFVGYGTYNGFSDCYWDYELANFSADHDGYCSGTYDISGIEGKTTADMKLQTTYSDWDFSSIWMMKTYPDLADTEILEDFEDTSLWNPLSTMGWWDIDGTLVYLHTLDTSIVHSGNQSMRVDYAKNGMPWSLFGGFIDSTNPHRDFTHFKKLRFWVYGDVTILVKLRDRNYSEQDVATVTGTTGTWTQVEVDFSSLSIDLSDVDNVLFFADPGESYTGGTFYIDDITLSE